MITMQAATNVDACPQLCARPTQLLKFLLSTIPVEFPSSEGFVIACFSPRHTTFAHQTAVTPVTRRRCASIHELGAARQSGQTDQRTEFGMISNIDRIREVFCGVDAPGRSHQHAQSRQPDEPAASCNRRNGASWAEGGGGFRPKGRRTFRELRANCLAREGELMLIGPQEGRWDLFSVFVELILRSPLPRGGEAPSGGSRGSPVDLVRAGTAGRVQRITASAFRASRAGIRRSRPGLALRRYWFSSGHCCD